METEKSHKIFMDFNIIRILALSYKLIQEC